MHLTVGKNKVDILGSRIDSIRAPELLKRMDEIIQDNRKTTLRRNVVFQYANIHAMNLAVRYRWFMDFLNNADLLYADGQGVRLGAWMLGRRLPERIVLTTWIWDVASHCARNGYSLFFLGATEAILHKAAKNLKVRFPELKIAGLHHGYFEKKGATSDSVVELINAAAPDVLFVGFGMPLQEEWVRDNLSNLKTHIVFTAGSCFDYVAGAKPVCPRWLSNAGFEWLFRLALEPRRLFVRYMVGNPLFVLRVIRQKFNGNNKFGEVSK